MTAHPNPTPAPAADCGGGGGGGVFTRGSSARNSRKGSPGIKALHSSWSSFIGAVLPHFTEFVDVDNRISGTGTFDRLAEPVAVELRSCGDGNAS